MNHYFVEQLSSLAHPQRLMLFRLLVRRYPDHLSAGEIAAVLDVRPNTLSTYLNTLRQAGLIRQTRAGRSLLYRVDMDTAGSLVSFLVDECCRGRPDLCPTGPDDRSGDVPLQRPVHDVLFICTGNSARSIFAEAILRDIGGGRFNPHSAGTRPASKIHPLARQVLEAHGHEWASLGPKTIAALPTQHATKMDFVFTVCDRAANEDGPTQPGQPITAHWGQPDPVSVTGTADERRAAFEQAYQALRTRIQRFTELDLATMDRLSRQRAVDDLATEKDCA
ncbi:helix-turn-helix domain-containing protein [Roseovarius tibetensis]|uniref:arsenate reductase/protein-tyrosine-phosphatase family protein n=1 Tax=Roseovarius tibetensis TaxID=2685897 RepID=UPI003D7F278B